MESDVHGSEHLTIKKNIKGIGPLLRSYCSYLFSNPFKSGLAYFLTGLIASLILGWIIYPEVLYSEKQQPLRFLHTVHLKNNIAIPVPGETETERCLFCHEFRDDGTFSGIPRLDNCIQCHDNPSRPLGGNPAEKKFMKEYVANNKEVPWHSYSRQPDCVFFPHVAHVKLGELECGTCHESHWKYNYLPIYQQNRLTGYSINIWGKNISGLKTNTWDRMKMDDCAECHISKGLEQNNACFVCHK